MDAKITPAHIAKLATIYLNPSERANVLLAMLEGLVLHGGSHWPGLPRQDIDRLVEADMLVPRTGRRQGYMLGSGGVKPSSTTQLVAALQAEYVAMSGGPTMGIRAIDHIALARLRHIADDEEIKRRWAEGVRARGWLSCATIHTLERRWNELGLPDRGGVMTQRSQKISESDKF